MLFCVREERLTEKPDGCYLLAISNHVAEGSSKLSADKLVPAHMMGHVLRAGRVSVRKLLICNRSKHQINTTSQHAAGPRIVRA